MCPSTQHAGTLGSPGAGTQGCDQWPHSHCWHLDIHTHTGTQNRVLLPENQLEMALNEKTSQSGGISAEHSHTGVPPGNLLTCNQPHLSSFSFPNHLDPSLFPPLMLPLNTLQEISYNSDMVFFPHPIVSAISLSKDLSVQKVTRRGFLITLHGYHPSLRG